MKKTFLKFLSRKSVKKQSRLPKRVKLMTKKIVNSTWYNIISFITMMGAFVGTIYKCNFYDDFMARTIVNVIFLVMIAWTGLSELIKAIVIKNEKRSEQFAYAGMWFFVFVSNFLGLVCN